MTKITKKGIKFINKKSTNASSICNIVFHNIV